MSTAFNGLMTRANPIRFSSLTFHIRSREAGGNPEPVLRALALLVALLSFAAAARAADLPDVKGLPYDQARAALLARGFKPQPPPYPFDTRCDEDAALCAKYPEFGQCWESTQGTCEFLWRAQGGEIISVQADSPEAPDARLLRVDKIEPMLPENRAIYFEPKPRFPRFRLHTPYSQVRAALAGAGYSPQIIRDRPMDEPTCERERRLCKAYPELLWCSGTGMSFCKWLFRRTSDGRFVTVTTDGEPPDGMVYVAMAMASHEEIKAARHPPRHR